MTRAFRPDTPALSITHHIGRPFRKSIKTTLHGAEISEQEIDDLAAYLTSLPPPPVVQRQNSDDVYLGFELFRSHGCVNCHAGETYTSDRSVDVGLKDELGHTLFNPPSLHGVAHRRKLFHDGRADSLEEVLGRFQHQLKRPHSDSDRHRLIQFLKSL